MINAPPFFIKGYEALPAKDFTELSVCFPLDPLKESSHKGELLVVVFFFSFFLEILPLFLGAFIISDEIKGVEPRLRILGI